MQSIEFSLSIVHRMVDVRKSFAIRLYVLTNVFSVDERHDRLTC
jgi:chaperone required for assembly of F1-ATPase